MRRIATVVLALAAAAVIPAGVAVVYYVFGTFSVPGAGEDVYAWSRIRNFSVLALIISLGHVLVLGVPSFFLLYWRKAITWWSSALVGFILGSLPIGVWVWPLRNVELKNSASNWGGEKMVSTMIDGVPTMAGWVIYMTGTATMGAFGGFGGFAFWLVWRTMRPNKALQGTHDEAARP